MGRAQHCHRFFFFLVKNLFCWWGGGGGGVGGERGKELETASTFTVFFYFFLFPPPIEHVRLACKRPPSSIPMSGTFFRSWSCLGHEQNSTAILPLPLIQEEKLLVTGERMCTKY